MVIVPGQLRPNVDRSTIFFDKTVWHWSKIEYSDFQLIAGFWGFGLITGFGFFLWFMFIMYGYCKIAKKNKVGNSNAITSNPTDNTTKSEPDDTKEPYSPAVQPSQDQDSHIQKIQAQNVTPTPT